MEFFIARLVHWHHEHGAGALPTWQLWDYWASNSQQMAERCYYWMLCVLGQARPQASDVSAVTQHIPGDPRHRRADTHSGFVLALLQLQRSVEHGLHPITCTYWIYLHFHFQLEPIWYHLGLISLIETGEKGGHIIKSASKKWHNTTQN